MAVAGVLQPAPDLCTYNKHIVRGMTRKKAHRHFGSCTVHMKDIPKCCYYAVVSKETFPFWAGAAEEALTCVDADEREREREREDLWGIPSLPGSAFVGRASVEKYTYCNTAEGAQADAASPATRSLFVAVGILNPLVDEEGRRRHHRRKSLLPPSLCYTLRIVKEL